MQKIDKRILWCAGILLGILCVLWLNFIPRGYQGLTGTIGYTFCHQDPSRSPEAFGHNLALCYRCMGLFSGIFIAFVWQLKGNRAAKFESRGTIIFLAVSLSFYVFDGVNASFLMELLSLKRLYPDQAWIRMLSGLLLGNSVSLVVFPLFNRVFFREVSQQMPLAGLIRKIGVILSDGIAMLLIFYGSDWLKLAVNILAVFSAVFIVTVLYSILATLISRQANQFESIRDGWGVILLGALGAMIQIAAITWLRYAVTKVWGWPFTQTAALNLPAYSTMLPILRSAAFRNG